MTHIMQCSQACRTFFFKLWNFLAEFFFTKKEIFFQHIPPDTWTTVFDNPAGNIFVKVRQNCRSFCSQKSPSNGLSGQKKWVWRKPIFFQNCTYLRTRFLVAFLYFWSFELFHFKTILAPRRRKKLQRSCASCFGSLEVNLVLSISSKMYLEYST